MKLYEIIKCEYGSETRANYGGGYTADDLKSLLKGYKREIIEFDTKNCFYTRKGSKYFYIVTEYNAE